MTPTIVLIYEMLDKQPVGTKFQLKFDNSGYGARAISWVWLEVKEGRLTVDDPTYIRLTKVAGAANLGQTPSLREPFLVAIADGFKPADFAYHITEGLLCGLKKIELVR